MNIQSLRSRAVTNMKPKVLLLATIPSSQPGNILIVGLSKNTNFKKIEQFSVILFESLFVFFRQPTKKNFL